MSVTFNASYNQNYNYNLYYHIILHSRFTPLGVQNQQLKAFPQSALGCAHLRIVLGQEGVCIVSLLEGRALANWLRWCLPAQHLQAVTATWSFWAFAIQNTPAVAQQGQSQPVCDTWPGCHVPPKLLLQPPHSQTLPTQTLPQWARFVCAWPNLGSTWGQSHWLRAWTHPKHSDPGKNQDLQKLLSSSRKHNGHSQELPQ